MQNATETAIENAAADPAAASTAAEGADLGWGEWAAQLDLETILAYLMPAIGALVLLIVGWVASKWISVLVSRGMQRANADMTLVKFFTRLTKWAIMIFVALTCLTVFGVEITAFAAVLAAAGFAIGLSFQGTLSNFAAGIMLLVFRPFKVGDLVNISGVTGIVDEIALFVTEIDTFDNRRMILPNGDVFGSTIENIAYHPRRRADIAVGTAYEADIDQTRDVLVKAAESVEGKLDDPAPMIVLDGLGDSSVNWLVCVWTPSSDYLAVKQATIRAVKYALDEAGISIPYPQRDVHLIKDE